MYLSNGVFQTVIKHTPLVSIDLVIYNESDEILLGYRKNRPAKGYWFVPGGRVQKDENLVNAFARLTNDELGCAFDFNDAEFIGPYEHMYADNVMGEDFSTHYVVLAYRINVSNLLLSLPKNQHSDYKWMTKGELLASKNVHKHTKWYFS